MNKRLPVSIVDESVLGPDNVYPTVGRFATLEEAYAHLETLDRVKIERGQYGVNAPESMMNPPKGRCS